MDDNKKSALILIENISFTFDNRVINETNALLEDGWDISVICPKDRRDPFHRKISDKLRVYYFPQFEARSALGHVFEHSVTLFFTTILSWFVFLRHRFHIVQGCNPMDIFWIVCLPFKPFGVKYIFDHHDLCPELYLSREEGSKDSAFYRILCWLEQMSFRFADVVISTNESYKRIAEDRGRKSSEDVFVVRNGPDLSKFHPVAGRSDLKNDDEILIGYLGTMNPQDGVEYLLDVAREIVIHRKTENVRFVMVGGGSYQPILKERCAEMGLTSYITFTGRVSDELMLSTLCACDVCVQPDPCNPLNDRSTMNKVMEYMALERPVVAFDLIETRVSCEDAALYAEPNSVQDLADKILEAAMDPAKRANMGRIGRDRIEQKLAWPFSKPHLLAAYAHASQVSTSRPDPAG